MADEATNKNGGVGKKTRRFPLLALRPCSWPWAAGTRGERRNGKAGIPVRADPSRMQTDFASVKLFFTGSLEVGDEATNKNKDVGTKARKCQLLALRRCSWP